MSYLKARLFKLERESTATLRVWLVRNAPMKMIKDILPDPYIAESKGWRVISYRDGQDISHLLV